jgi:hypothetical protein
MLILFSGHVYPELALGAAGHCISLLIVREAEWG